MSANVVADTITTAESSHPPALSLTQQRESPPRAATTTASSSTGTSRSRAPSNIVRAFVTISRRDTGTHGEHCDSVQLVVVDETTLEVVGRSPAPDFHATTAYSTLSCVSTDEMALERGKSYHIVADFQSTCDEGSCKDFYWISVVRPYALCGEMVNGHCAPSLPSSPDLFSFLPSFLPFFLPSFLPSFSLQTLSNSTQYQGPWDAAHPQLEVRRPAAATVTRFDAECASLFA